MANYATLKAAITAAIKQNGNNEITGNLLQQQLLAMVNSLGVGYQYVGIATADTDPGTPDQNVFYLASTAGTYTNFDGLVLAKGEIAILKYNGAWSKDSTGAASVEMVNQLGQELTDYGYEIVSEGLNNKTIFDPQLFEQGDYLFTAGQLPTTRNLKYRIRCKSVLYTGKQFTLTAKPNFRFYLATANSDGTIAHAYGWQTQFDIPVGYYYILIARSTDVSSETLSVSYLLPKVVFDSLLPETYNTNVLTRYKYYDRDFPGFMFGSLSFSGASASVISTRTCIMSRMYFWMGYGDTIYVNSPYKWSLAVFESAQRNSGGFVAQNIAGGAGNAYTCAESGYYLLTAFKTDGSEISASEFRDIVSKVVITKNYKYFDETAWMAGEVELFKELAFNTGSLATAMPNFIIPGSGDYKTRWVSRAICLPFAATLTIDKSGIDESVRKIRFILAYHDAGTHDTLIKTAWNSDTIQTYNILPNKDYFLAAAYSDDTALELSTLASVSMLASAGFESTDGTGILQLNPESEVVPKIENLRIGHHAQGQAPAASTLTLLHFSDLHNDADNLARIKEFREKYLSYIDGVLNTGDIINAFNQGMVSGMPNWIMNTIGNHEAQSHAGGVWTDVPATDVYALCIAPYVSNWGVTQPAGASANGYNYYYKDYADKGVRLIVTDCEYWDATQKTWLESVLADARTNSLHVLCAVHRPPFVIDQQLDRNPFTGIDFNSTTASRANPEMAQTVQSFINDGGFFVGWLCGHIHQDSSGFGRTSDGFQKQFAFSIACAGLGAAPLYGEMARSVRNRTQDCFNIIGVDTQTKTLRIMRVGANYDDYMRRRNTMSVNYDTAQIIYADM